MSHDTEAVGETFFFGDWTLHFDMYNRLHVRSLDGRVSLMLPDCNAKKMAVWLRNESQRMDQVTGPTG